MTEQEVLYRFTPHEHGEWIRGVPRRDLTQRDIDRMTGRERADAFGRHPLNGKSVYTEVRKPKAETKGGDA